MKILLPNNYYDSTAPKGEIRVFEAERDLLKQRWHEVGEFLRYSDDIRAKGVSGSLQGVFSSQLNPFAAKVVGQSFCDAIMIAKHEQAVRDGTFVFSEKGSDDCNIGPDIHEGRV